MRPLLLALLAASSAAPALRGQTTQDPRQAILAARDTVWRAWFSNDTALLRRFIPPAAATAEGAGTMHWGDRAEIASGARQFAGTGRGLIDLRFANTDVAQTGQSAIVRSYYTFVVDAAGKQDTSRGRATE